MAKLSKAQQERLQAQEAKRAALRAQDSADAQARYRAATEKARLYNEQEAARKAALTEEQRQAEAAARQAKIDADHRIAIETDRRRMQPAKAQSYPYRPYVDEEE